MLCLKHKIPDRPCTRGAWPCAGFRLGWSHHTLKPLGAGSRGTDYIVPVTSAIENVNLRLRKIIKTRGHLPINEAATNFIWLARRKIAADWGRAAHD